MTLLTDPRGLPLTTDEPAAVARLEGATRALLAHAPEAGEALAAALAADPGLVLGHTLAGFQALMLARAELRPAAAAALAAARESLAARGGTARECAHVAALAAWAERGEMEEAAALLDAATAREPLDALGLKLAHAIRFMLGDAPGMRAPIAAALARWPADAPGRGFLLGCLAFALEEGGAPREAERLGREAAALEPDDLWAVHAVAHVMEAEGRAREGILWLGRSEPALRGGAFARHLFWHRALFHLHLGETEPALALYDRRVRDMAGEEYRDVANAASLLWRLASQGVPVGRRWEELADIAERRIGDHSLVFADLHHVLSLAAAGRGAPLRRFLAGMRDRALTASGSQPRLIAEVGLPAARAVAGALGHGLGGAMPVLPGVGGSHAQRDLFERLAISAASDAERATMLAERRRRRAPGAWEAGLAAQAEVVAA